MKVEIEMCYSHLIAMLLLPEEVYEAISSFTCTTPDMKAEVFNGFMATQCTFMVKDLNKFAKLWDKSYVYPSDRAKWYNKIKTGSLFI
jgi:hypothetical protein